MMKKTKNKLVVAIVSNWNGLAITYKGRPITKTCIDSLKKTKYPNMKIVIADQGSTDGSKEYFLKRYKDIGISKAEDKGWAHGIDKGIEYAFRRYPELEYIALLNNDLEFKDHNWLEKLVNAAEKDAQIGVVGCRLKYSNGSIQHGGAEITLSGARHVYDKKISQTSRYSSLVTGAVILVRRKLLSEIGMIDETFLPFYWEDSDFEDRAKEKGFKIYYVGTTDIIHFQSHSINSDVKKKWNKDEINGIYRRNGYIYFLRHKPLLMPLYFAADFASNFIAVAPKTSIRKPSVMVARLRTQFHVLSDALKSYRIYNVHRNFFKN